MISKNELRYTLALQRVPNLGDTSAKKLILKVGSAEGVFKEKKTNLLKVDGVGQFKIKELSEKIQLDQADEELRFIEKEKLDWVYFKDSKYPENLKHCNDAPILFFQKGNIGLKNKKIISIVGTRKATTYGKGFCEKLIEDLAPLQPIIVSGFAYGIDITAHKAAIDQNLQTIACLAHGMNQIYPKSHKKYQSSVEENGGFITEFWSTDVFDRNNFLKRNRIIAGIAQATIVIESSEKGGSLVTADIANSYNRDVFAVPGRALDINSMGCNNLIKTQQAHLLSSAADLIYLLGWEIENKKNITQQTKLFIELTEDEKKVYQFLKEHPKEMLDSLAIACNLPTYTLSSLLLNLELKGLIKPLPGKTYVTI